MSVDVEKERADFEASFTPKTKDGEHWMRRGANGDYRNPSTQSSWAGWHARAQAAQPAPIPAQTDDLQAVHAFLMGEKPLDGVLFGEKPASERGTFWWRKSLRAAIAGNALTEEAKDAARYRWLRDGSWNNQTHPEIREHMMTRVDRVSLDTAIDVHIKAGQAGKEGS